MKTTNDLRIQHKCENCQLQQETSFCKLPAPELETFESIKVTKAYPKGANLFIEGQPTHGVYVLCQGRVKLSTCSRGGKIMILGIAAPGDVLGLSSALSGLEYETTAEVLELCQVNFISTPDLLRFLKTNPQACLNAAKQLGRNYHTAYQQICSLGLSDSAADKLAKLFLGWTGNGTGGDGKVRIKNYFTHEEIAEMIGASRETVTRALKHFREIDLVTLKGSDLVIHDRKRLRAAIGNS
jgi:CRP/FNR family transcriptional regulator